MKRFRFAGRFRFQSVLMKTVLLLFLFTVLAFASFAWVFHTVVTKNFRETEYQSLFSVLSRTSGSVDTVLEQVEVRMEEFLEAPSTTSYLVAPERNDFERMFRVSTALVQLGNKNDLILSTSEIPGFLCSKVIRYINGWGFWWWSWIPLSYFRKCRERMSRCLSILIPQTERRCSRRK